SFGHEGEAAARCGAHGARPRVTCSDGDIGDGELVFHLLHDNAATLGMLSHPGENPGGRSHWIRGIETAACSNRADAECFVASDIGPAFATKFPLVAEWNE